MEKLMILKSKFTHMIKIFKFSRMIPNQLVLRQEKVFLLDPFIRIAENTLLLRKTKLHMKGI